jgi:DNA-binding SARP family transcriptional activator
LPWPIAGEVRAHLPLRWVVELVAAASAARNPSPDDLLDVIRQGNAGPVLDVLASAGRSPIADAARRLQREVPNVPGYQLRVDVLGPLRICRDGMVLDDPELRRQRVRELVCCLVAWRRARRAAIAEALWPDSSDSASNLRVTLGYLQRVLEPDRPRRHPPFFVRTNGEWLELAGTARLEVDSWEFEARVDEAAAAERSGDVASALTAYRDALWLWRGDPFADAPYSMWAEPERVRIRSRYLTAALRAGELWLAARAADDAAWAAERALDVDPTWEPAHRLLARSLLVSGDRLGARDALERCLRTLADLDVPPDGATTELLASVRAGVG